jgi:spore germination protein KC
MGFWLNSPAYFFLLYKKKKRGEKMKRLFPLLLTFTLLTGCWDFKDIETRGYVLGIAIDKYPPNPIKTEQSSPGESTAKEEVILEGMELHTGEPVYAMTVQLPLIKKVEGVNSGSEGGSINEGTKTWEITQIGNSFISMNREMQSRTPLTLYYEHLQVIIISQEVAREGIEKIMDFFIRDPETRRRVKVFISTDDAKSILDVVPKVEDYSSLYLAKLPMSATKNSRVVHNADLGDIIKHIHGGRDFVAPMVQVTKDEIKTSGGAAFRGDKMVGWVSELELEAIKFIRGIYLGGVITVKSPDKERGRITLEITKAKSKITPEIKGDLPGFKVDINVEGDYAEEINIHTHGKITPEFLKKIEKECANEIERMCYAAIKKAQEDLKADVFQFDHILMTEKPAYWKTAGSQWNDIFPVAEVKINTEVKISLLGLAK